VENSRVAAVVSYDLFITPKQFDARAISEWLGWRDHYEVTENQAFYSNDDTGVYFSFSIETSPEQEEGEEQRSPHVVFNLNFYRPHTFALEAEPEVAAFLHQFDSTVHDPQSDGIGDGPYSREGFLSGWNTGNRFGFSVMGQHTDSPPPWPADPALIEAVWKWNYGRAALQKTAGDQVFVPRISWFLPTDAAAPVPTCIWTDRVPTMIPETLVSDIALVRQPRQGVMGMLGLSRKADKPMFDLKLAGVKGIAHMPGMDRGDAHGQSVFYTPLVQTTEMNKLFSGAWPPDAARIVPAEQVCGSDLVALIRKKS
jgi:hypothetical protein